MEFTIKIFLLTILVVENYAFHNILNKLFGSWREHETPETIRIYLEEDEELIVPKHARIKIMNSASSDKFYMDLSKINKKPPEYLRHTPVGKLMSSLKVDDEKNCCGNEWKETEVDFEELFRPVSVPKPPTFNFVPSAQLHEIPYIDDDVKPVTEHIDDDLNYDFRTKTHSI